jgi:hypothetical protein
MPQTITIPDDLYARLGSLARPFQDKEPADVIRWLLEGETGAILPTTTIFTGPGEIEGRVPRERGAIIDLGGVAIKAHTVSDLCSQVMESLFARGHGSKIFELAPYSTSTKRYLFAKTPVHPNGKDFFVSVKCRGLHIETHKNYKTAIEQLARLSSKCGIKLAYKGT